MQKRFFAVTAKCGHVGRQFYYEGIFYISAFTVNEAVAIVRNKPRVKHDHKDAILWAEEITSEAYKSGQEAFKSEAYFCCESRWQQNFFWGEIVAKLRPETEISHKYRQKIGYEKCDVEPRIKKPYKRERFVFCEEDIEVIAV